MRIRLNYTLSILAALSLSACTIYDKTPTPDYTIRVMESNGTTVAVPPDCAEWSGEEPNPFDQQPLLQFKCANARNLAMMVERPDDLVAGRTLDNTRSSVMIGAVRRYDANTTRGMIWTGTDPTAVATTTKAEKTGDTPTGGGGSSAAASSGAAP